MRDPLLAHDTAEPVSMTRYGSVATTDRPTDPLPTVHTVELATFLQHREAVIALARETVDRAEADPGPFGPLDVVSVARSLVARITGEADRIARHSAVYDVHTGEADDSLPSAEPDPFERVRSTSKPTRRTRKGSPVDEVVRHGRAVVVGSTRATPNGAAAMSADHVSHVLATTPRATIGHDGLSIYRATQVIFGDAIPRLLAGDTVARAEFGTWDEVQAMTRRQSRGSNGSTRISWPVRTTVNGPGAWRADELPRANQFVETWSHGRIGTGSRWARVTELAAMTDDERVTIGHRPARDRSPVKVNRGAIAARTVGTVALPFTTQPVADGLTEAAATLNPGERVRVVLRDEHGRDEYLGSVTMSGAKRYSMTTGLGKIRGARSLKAFRTRARELTEA